MIRAAQLQTIVRPGWTGHGNPISHLGPMLRKKIESHDYDQTRGDRLVRLIECYLQVTRQHLPDSLSDPIALRFIFGGFIGAIWSPEFMNLPSMTRYTVTKSFTRAVEIGWGAETREQLAEIFRVSTVGVTPSLKICISIFQRLDRNPEMVWLWSGWAATNLAGRLTWFQFRPIYDLLGKSFTEELFIAASTFYATRRTQRVPGLMELCNFLAQPTSREYLPGIFDVRLAALFWDQFFRYYIQNGIKTALVSTLVRNYRAEFLPFANEYLFRPSLFVRPPGRLPMPPSDLGNNLDSRLERKNGATIWKKLITDIPLEISDEEAMELLFNRIESDINVAIDWAEKETSELDMKIRRRRQWAKSGFAIVPGKPTPIPKSHLISTKNPDHLLHAAATYELHGHRTEKEVNLSAEFPNPIAETAHQLGLPTAGGLLPHCVLLVADHPQITCSFLENFELFAPFGTRSGFYRLDGGYYLDGTKNRKGPRQGQQKIKLSKRGIRTVLRILRATAPLREFLRKRGDDRWRFLLITSGEGFAYPLPVLRLATYTSGTVFRNRNCARLALTWGASAEERADYVARFSLPALRSSVGTLIYIRTGSLHAMAEALGHSQYEPRLLDRYLPRPIRDFFQERWIRIFQEGFVLQALEGSPYQFRASSLNSIEQISTFLRNHALPPLEQLDHKSQRATSIADNNKVIISVDEEILTILLSINAAVLDSDFAPNGVAIFWSKLAERLKEWIQLSRRDDLKLMLNAALARIDGRPYASKVCAS